MEIFEIRNRIHSIKYGDEYKGESTDWPTNISTASELMDEFKHSGKGTMIDINIIGECIVRFYIDDINYYDGRADTLPLAICLAYLAWKDKYCGSYYQYWKRSLSGVHEKHENVRVTETL